MGNSFGGHELQIVTDTQRALFLGIALYKTFYPKGLTSKTGSVFDISALEEALQRKM